MRGSGDHAAVHWIASLRVLDVKQLYFMCPWVSMSHISCPFLLQCACEVRADCWPCHRLSAGIISKGCIRQVSQLLSAVSGWCLPFAVSRRVCMLCTPFSETCLRSAGCGASVMFDLHSWGCPSLCSHILQHGNFTSDHNLPLTVQAKMVSDQKKWQLSWAPPNGGPAS